MFCLTEICIHDHTSFAILFDTDNELATSDIEESMLCFIHGFFIHEIIEVAVFSLFSHISLEAITRTVNKRAALAVN